MDGTLSERISSLNTPFSPTKSSWPTNSSNDFGRIRSARGMASVSAFRLTLFDGWIRFEGSGCAVSTTGCCGIGGDACGAGLFFEGLEKNPDPPEGYRAVQRGNIENYTESSLGSSQLLSMCLFMDDSGTLA